MLYIFGGYLNGYKSNILFKIDIMTKCITILSENIPENHPEAANVPIQRTGARIVYSPDQDCIYLFGGLSTLTTLNDMWKYDMMTNEWEKVRQLGRIPEPRCGHSLSILAQKIFLFGGLIEVTQESN